MVSGRVYGFVLLMLAAVSTADASDADVLRAHDRDVTALVRSVGSADLADPAGVEEAYRRARDLQVRLTTVRADTRGCRDLLSALGRLADLGVAVSDGFDRLDAGRVRRARAAFDRQRTAVAGSLPRCRTPARRGPRVPGSLVIIEPPAHAVVGGRVSALLPPGATGAELIIDGRRTGSLTVRSGRAVGALSVGPGRHTVGVRATRGGAVLSTAVARDVWAVPRREVGVASSATVDAAASRDLERAAARFDGIAAAWILDPVTGRGASWNADASFTAASTVKLGVMVEAARRMGPLGRSPLDGDVVAVGGWSSNLAVNRILPRVGGSGAVQRRLHRMGAVRSTFTGPYMVATESGARSGSPPATSRRLTTAADLGRVLWILDRSARGDIDARRLSGLTPRQARFVLGTLYGSERDGDNAGILGLGPGPTAAQKHGWVRSFRHSAAIIEGARGPRIVVALTWSPGLTRARAERFGSEVVAVAARM